MKVSFIDGGSRFIGLVTAQMDRLVPQRGTVTLTLPQCIIRQSISLGRRGKHRQFKNILLRHFFRGSTASMKTPTGAMAALLSALLLEGGSTVGRWGKWDGKGGPGGEPARIAKEPEQA